MTNTIFQQILKKRIDNCIAQAKTVALLKHNGLTGEIREILISNILIDLLPDGFKIGTGKVSDYEGNLSNQVDIIIYNKSKFPPILYDETKGIFPIESVAYIIEVKSVLNSSALKSTISKAENLRKLKGKQPHFVLFAYNSDLKDKNSDLKRMTNYLPSEKPALNIYCITNRLYGYYSNNKWQNFNYTKDNYEIVSLIIGILNTLMNWKYEDNKIVPGHYFGIV